MSEHDGDGPSAGHARLSGWTLRLVSGLLRLPVLGPPLRRALAASTVEPHLARMDLSADGVPAPMAAPPEFFVSRHDERRS